MAKAIHWQVEWFGQGPHPACRDTRWRKAPEMEMTTDPEAVTCKQVACRREARQAMTAREAEARVWHEEPGDAVRVRTPEDVWEIWLAATDAEGRWTQVRIGYNDARHLEAALARARQTLYERDHEKYDQAWDEEYDRARLRAMTPEARAAELARRDASK